MSIMDLFKKGSTAAKDAGIVPNDPSAGNPTAPGGSSVVPDGTGPKAFGNAAGADESPLDGFKDLWKNADTDAKAPADFVPSMTIDGKKLMNAASQIDFSKVLNADVVGKALQGDSASFAQALNSVSQAVFAQATATNAKVLEDALRKQADSFKNDYLPEVLRRERVGNALRENNPLLEDPSIAPVFSMIQEQLTKKFPMASAAEIKSKATDYFNGMAGKIAGSQGKQLADVPKPSAGSDYDWGAFFDGNS